MIRLDMPQGSQSWIEARLGLPTASQFHRIMTPKTMKPSGSAPKYAHELACERIMGESLDPYLSEFMERGTDMENQAVAYFELQRDIDCEVVGFCLSDDGKLGCSPDRLVGKDGGLEIKVPSAIVHAGYLFEPPTKYLCQIQGAMLVTGRAWWDFLSFNPSLPPVLVRYERDEKFIARLSELLAEFCEKLDTTMTQMNTRYGVAK